MAFEYLILTDINGKIKMIAWCPGFHQYRTVFTRYSDVLEINPRPPSDL